MQHDLSQVLHQYLRSKPVEKLFSASTSLSAEEARVKNLVSKCYSLATNCWTWRDETTLFTGQMSGHVVKYLLSNNIFTVKSIIKTGLREISCLEHHVLDNVELLVVAGEDGRVEVMKIVKEKMSSLGFLWSDPDRLVVSKIMFHHSNNQTSVYLAKANFCVQMRISLSKGSKLNIGNPVNFNTGMTRIVGMEILDDKIVLSNQKSVTKICDINNVSDHGDVSLDLKRGHYFCQGLAASVNGSVVACLENISTFHDHLIARDPSRLVFWSLDTVETLRTKLELNHHQLSRCADVLDCYKCLLTEDNNSELQISPSLSVMWWHYKILCQKNSGENNFKENVLKYEAAIRSKVAAENLSNNKAETRIKAASAKFLSNFSQDINIIKISNDYINSGQHMWRCRLCHSEEDSDDVHVSSVTCGQGHTWPRCTSSQLPVDSTNPGRCCWCRSMTLSTSGSCCLCQGPLLTRT